MDKIDPVCPLKRGNRHIRQAFTFANCLHQEAFAVSLQTNHMWWISATLAGSPLHVKWTVSALFQLLPEFIGHRCCSSQFGRVNNGTAVSVSSLVSLCIHSYGKAAFCLEELMMTNPHNHLYCEQYAEVGTRLAVRHQHRGKLWTECCEWCVSPTLGDIALSGVGAQERSNVYTGLLCFRPGSDIIPSLLEQSFSTAFSHRWSTLRGGWRTWSWPESISPRRWGWTTETWGHCSGCTWWVSLCIKRTRNGGKEKRRQKNKTKQNKEKTKTQGTFL